LKFSHYDQEFCYANIFVSLIIIILPVSVLTCLLHINHKMEIAHSNPGNIWTFTVMSWRQHKRSIMKPRYVCYVHLLVEIVNNVIRISCVIFSHVSGDHCFKCQSSSHLLVTTIVAEHAIMYLHTVFPKIRWLRMLVKKSTLLEQFHHYWYTAEATVW